MGSISSLQNAAVIHNAESMAYHVFANHGDGVDQTPIDILKAARALLSDPDKWTGGLGPAVDKDGQRLWPRSPGAVRFSLCGALWRCARSDNGADWQAQLAMIAVCRDKPDRWSKGRSHAEAIGLYDRAVAFLREDGDLTWAKAFAGDVYA